MFVLTQIHMVMYRNIYRTLCKQIDYHLNETSISDIPIAINSPNTQIVDHIPLTNKRNWEYLEKGPNLVLRQRLNKMSLEPLAALK